jgi:glycerophosphoryl diester phosphodiesterase family protein
VDGVRVGDKGGWLVVLSTFCGAAGTGDEGAGVQPARSSAPSISISRRMDLLNSLLEGRVRTAVTMGQLVPEDKNLRRPMTFGALLDETIQIFRGSWARFLALSAVALIPSGLLLGLEVAVGPAALLSTRLVAPGGAINAAALGAAVGFGVLIGVINGLFTLLWTVAITIQTSALLTGEQIGLSRVYGRALGRLLPTIGAGLLVVFAAIPLLLVSAVVFVVTLGPIGMLADVVLLLVWWLNPGARNAWTKWLIIACTPLGLVMYFTVRWVLFTPAVVLERRGPLDALERSAALVRGQWFRVLGVLTVIGIIVAILVLVPSGLVSLLTTLVLSNVGRSMPLTLVNNLASVVGQVLFGAIAYIAYTLLFLDLRNRREGADLEARLESLERMASLA